MITQPQGIERLPATGGRAERAYRFDADLAAAVAASDSNGQLIALLGPGR
jgi:hypothetical protein